MEVTQLWKLKDTSISHNRRYLDFAGIIGSQIENITYTQLIHIKDYLQTDN